MSVMIIPRRHITQPQGRVAVDFNNPLCRNLVCAVNPAALVDDVQGRAITEFSADVSSYAGGLTRKFAGATGRLITTLTHDADLRTIMTLVRRDGTGGGTLGRVYSKGDTNNLYNNINRLRYQHPTSGNSAFSVATSTSLIVSGQYYWVAVTHDRRSIDNLPKIFVNGYDADATTIAGAASGGWVTNQDTFTIGNTTTLSRGWDGEIGNFLVWDRVLEANEIAELSLNPWQLFRADPLRIYSFAASGPLSWSSLTASNMTPTTATLTLGGITR